MLAYLFVALALIMRIPSVPHPWGFTPVTAALLYFGARGARRQWWIPLGLLIVADIVLDKFFYAYPLSWDLFLTWAWYGAMILLGTRLRENVKPLPVFGAALSGSISFFLISNFGVWLATNMYPRTLEGLTTCYAAAIPFFRRGLEGDLLFTAVIFGLPVVAASLAKSASSSGGTAAA
jgi:uncharacterized protein DUF6580